MKCFFLAEVKTAQYHLQGETCKACLICIIAVLFVDALGIGRLFYYFILKKFILTFRCCNTCDDVREAYRRRGWAFKTPDTIEQCKRDSVQS